MIVIEINNFTLDLEITDENQDKFILSHELFHQIHPMFEKWLDTMNLKLEEK